MPRRVESESQIGRRLRLKDLHLFVTVMQCKSMAKAAEQLGISQPAVSEVIAGLEHALGARLFDRSPRGVEPTVYGQALLQRSRAAFDELKQGIKDIESLSDPATGELRIACGTTLSASILPSLVDGFAKAYPRVVIHIQELTPPTRELSGLRERKYDLVLGRLLAPLAVDPLGDDVNVEVLFDDRLVIAAGAQSHWASRRKLDLGELINEPWIVTDTNSWQSQRLREAFHRAGRVMPKINVVSASVHVTTHLLSSGRFVTAISKLVADRYGLKVLPVKLPIRPSPIVIVTLKNRTLTSPAERFIRHARDAAKSFALGRI
jgi:DNA-binding transcriptional LysR family regulator